MVLTVWGRKEGLGSFGERSLNFKDAYSQGYPLSSAAIGGHDPKCSSLRIHRSADALKPPLIVIVTYLGRALLIWLILFYMILLFYDHI